MGHSEVGSDGGAVYRFSNEFRASMSERILLLYNVHNDPLTLNKSFVVVIQRVRRVDELEDPVTVQCSQ
jgi:hypothetical protein